MRVMTGSLQRRKKATDGLRICVMRRIKPTYDFDMWIPGVAPSERLLEQYIIDKKISWKEFVPKYLTELSKKRALLHKLTAVTKTQKVTLLCWEKSAKYCHRSILARELLGSSVV